MNEEEKSVTVVGCILYGTVSDRLWIGFIQRILPGFHGSSDGSGDVNGGCRGFDTDGVCASDYG